MKSRLSKLEAIELKYKETQKVIISVIRENKYLKKELENKSLCFEGNNGGDIIELLSRENGKLELRIGRCCIYLFNGYGTVEDITEKLEDILNGIRSNRGLNNDQ